MDGGGLPVPWLLPFPDDGEPPAEPEPGDSRERTERTEPAGDPIGDPGSTGNEAEAIADRADERSMSSPARAWWWW